MNRGTIVSLAVVAVAAAWPVESEDRSFHGLRITTTRPLTSANVPTEVAGAVAVGELERRQSTLTSLEIIFLPTDSSTTSMSNTNASSVEATSLPGHGLTTTGRATTDTQETRRTSGRAPIPEPTPLYDDISFIPVPGPSTSTSIMTITITPTTTVFAPPAEVESLPSSQASDGATDLSPGHSSTGSDPVVDITSEPLQTRDTSIPSEHTQTQETEAPRESPDTPQGEESQGCQVTLRPSLGIVIVVGAGAAFAMM